MDNYSHDVKTNKSLFSSVFSIMKTGTTKTVPKIKVKPVKIKSVCNGKNVVIIKNLEKKSENFENIFNNSVDSNQIINYFFIIIILFLLFILFKKKY